MRGIETDSMPEERSCRPAEPFAETVGGHTSSDVLAELKAQGELERSPWTRLHLWSQAHPVRAGTALVCGAVLLISVGLLLRGIRLPNIPAMETHKEPPPRQTQGSTVAYIPFSLDLRPSSLVRGAGSSKEVHPNDLKLISDGRAFWSKSALAHLQKGKTQIHAEADFRQVSAGNYNLEVRSSVGIRFTQLVSLPAGLSSGGESRP